MHTDVANLNKASIWMDASRIVPEEGFRAFWKGNLVTIVHRLPYSSISFYAYECYKNQSVQSIPGLERHRENVTSDLFVQLVGEGLAGIIAASITYPLDLVRMRLAAQLRGLDLNTNSSTLRKIKAATNNFAAANKIGEGGFGPVDKGHLLDGTPVAVKQLSSKSKQGNREFLNEIGMISVLQHPNLTRLYECCMERNQLLLVYEYMEKNNLSRALFGI